MSFFPRSFISDIHNSTPSTSASSSFHPLFRLLDDFDNYRTGADTSRTHRQSHLASMRTFTPKFDVKEVGDVYELHGELPGIAQQDVEIEFSDESTITIRGRTEQSYTNRAPDAVEAAERKAISDASTASRKEHQPTVEDEDGNKVASETGNTSTSNSNEEQQLEKVTEGAKSVEKPQTTYWVSERSVGEFARSFTFPVRVDQDQVKAKMQNGILSVVVPKAKKVEGRRIVIE